MTEKKYKVFLATSLELIDFEKAGRDDRFVNKPCGEYVATLRSHPYESGGSDWLVLDGTTVGATLAYFLSQAKVVEVIT